MENRLDRLQNNDWACKFTIKSLALHQVEVIGLLQDAILEAAAQTFQITVVDIEFLKPHFVI